MFNPKKAFQLWPLWRQVAVVFLFAVVIVGFLSGEFVRKFETGYLFKRLETQSKKMFAVLTAASADAIITEDIPLLETIVNQTVQTDPNIISFIITNEEGISLLQWKSDKTVPPDSSLSYSDNLIIEDEAFGKMKIEVNIESERIGIQAHVNKIRFFITGVLLFLACLIVFLIYRMTIQPIQKIDVRLKGISEGDLSSKLQLSSSREFTNLAESINMMGDVLREQRQREEEYSQRLEQQVQERTAALKDLLNSIGQGFLTFDQDFAIHKEYSSACETFFGKPIAGLNVLKLLFDEEEETVEEALNLVFDESAPFHLIEELLPSECRTNELFLATEYRWLSTSEQNSKNRVMVILTDVTAKKKLEIKIREEQTLHAMILKVAVDREGFLQFIREITYIFNKIFICLEQSPDAVDVDELFRYFHTIKGGAATYSLEDVCREAHLIETEMEDVRSGQKKISSQTITQLFQLTSALKETLDFSLKKLEGIISEEDLSGTMKRIYRISESKLNRLYEEMLNIPAEFIEKLQTVIDDLRKQPVSPVLKKYGVAAEGLAEKLNKQIQVELTGLTVEVNHDKLESLFSAMVHLVRNAVDHGLEETETRIMLDKPEVGSLKIETATTENYFKINIADDGGGIDLEEVKKIGIQKQIISESQSKSITDEEAACLIFAPGFSTKEEVSDVSGRGVGMDAVKAAVNDLDGSIQIKSELDRGTNFEIAIPISRAI